MPILVNLYNPTLAARVIYDGITNSAPIRVGAGETVNGVLLAEHIVAMLKHAGSLGDNVDLKVTEIAVEPTDEGEDLPNPIAEAPHGFAPRSSATASVTKPK